MQLVFEVPDENAPGYLKRIKKALSLKRRIAQPDNIDDTLFTEMVDFLAEYVTEPADREQAKEALWDASQKQFVDLLNSVTGGNATDPLA